MTYVAIPKSIDDLTKSWLQSALSHSTNESIGQIERLDIETIGTGVGLIGCLYRCNLTYESDQNAGPASVVVKIRSDVPESRKVAKTFQLYEKEVAFYRDMATATPIAVPHPYFCAFDSQTHDFVLVLEDLNDFQVTSQLEGGTEEQARIAIRNVATLHGTFWNRTNEPPLRNYFSLLEPSVILKMHVGFRRSVPKVLEVFDADLSPSSKKLIRALGDTFAGHYDEIGNFPLTLTHNDYRLDNMFFGNTDERELVVIDWQTHGIGVGMTDVAYFMAGSLPSDVRKKVEKELVAEYHDITSRIGNAEWSETECWEAYRQSFVVAMTVPVIAAGELSLEIEGAFELVQTGIQRMNTALDELEVAEFMPQRKSIFSKPGLRSAFANQLTRFVS